MPPSRLLATLDSLQLEAVKDDLERQLAEVRSRLAGTRAAEERAAAQRARARDARTARKLQTDRRALEALAMARRGFHNADIARRLDCSVRTVERLLARNFRPHVAPALKVD